MTKTSIALAIAAAAAIAGAAVGLSGADGDSAAPVGGAPVPPAAGTAQTVSGATRYIVVYREAPLSTYKGGLKGLPAPMRLEGFGRARRAVAASAEVGRVDVQSSAARHYVDHLGQVQRNHEQRIGREIGRSLRVQHRMRHALNAVITEMTASEAARVGRLPEVQLVEAYREYEQTTDTGPTQIGAPALWNAVPVAYRGEGVVIGIIDSGINFGSPGFAAVDDSGYRHINPRGTGVYLGTCAPGGIDEGRCNDKLIGGYDFICGNPANICGTPGTREEPGFADTNSHGSHVASTAGGNAWTARYKDRELRISGVAPHANIIAYDACYTRLADNVGPCPSTATARAIDQAIADGVDVINYSISGGTSPWGEAVSLAFLNATDAGIYVAAAAGNAGPGPATTGHFAPWVGTTAAAQHGRGAFGFLTQVTGPGAVPATLQAIIALEGAGSAAHNAAVANDTPLRVSPGIDSANDGCAAFAPAVFQGAIALVRRGTCSFTIKVANAANAGAVAVLLANNQPGSLTPSVPGAPVRTFLIEQVAGNAIRDFAAANGNTSTAGIGYPPLPLPNLPDVLASFSSRGPAGAFDLIKPDVTAPGVDILAVTAGSTISPDHNNSVGLISGTSMASPHHAGAAALLRQARPDWTVAEIKSALMMTAKLEVFKEDTVTAADPYAMGAGRIQVDQALRAGLVLNETTANYRAADPSIGGDPSSLNLPSLSKTRCINTCAFTRTFRNALATRQTWVVRSEGVSGLVSPSVFSLNPGESKSVKFTYSGGNLPKDGSATFGRVVLTAQGGNTNQPVLRLPVAIAVPPAAIALNPQRVALTLPAGGAGAINVRIDNIGGGPLDYQIDNTGVGANPILNQARSPTTDGYFSSVFTDPGAGSRAMFGSDDFRVDSATRLSMLSASGLMVSGASLAATAASITWSVFPDNNGMPAGDPYASPQLAVWSYTAAPNSVGVRITGADIRLDLIAAGQNVNLPAGRYWLVVHTRSSAANRWAWVISDTGDSSIRGNVIAPNGIGAWGPTAVPYAGLAMRVEEQGVCGAAWIGAPNRAFGRIVVGANYTTQVQISAAGLAPGTHEGFLCVASNDVINPKRAVRVVLTVQ